MITIKADLTGLTADGLVRAHRGMVFDVPDDDLNLQVGDSAGVVDFAGGERLTAVVVGVVDSELLLDVDWESEPAANWYTPSSDQESVEDLLAASLKIANSSFNMGGQMQTDPVPA